MSRNVALASIAGKLRRQGHDEAGILAALLSHPERRDLPDSECRSIARSIAAKPAGQARPSLPPDLSAIERLALARGFAPSAFAALGAESSGGEVHFPMRNERGEFIGWRRRRGDTSPFPGGQKCLSAKGSTNGPMVGPWPLPAEGIVLVAEGEMDACAALTHGAPAVVATPGAKVSLGCLTALQRWCAGRECVLAPDPDEAGAHWRDTVATALRNAGATVRMIPPLAVDLDKRLARETCPQEALAEMIAAAVPVPTVDDKGGDASQPHPWADGIAGAELWRTRPTRGFVAKGLIVERSITVVCGAAGDLKTAMLMAAAWCVAEGKPWLGMETRACPVLWYNADMDTDETVLRLQAFGRGGGHSWAAPVHLFSFPTPALRLDDPTTVDLLVAKALAVRAGLIVLDCLIAVKGDAEENSASEMAPVMRAIRHVTERTRAAVLVIHHTARGEGSKFRGSSAIRDLADLTLHVTRQGETATMRPDKVRRNVPKIIAADFHFIHREGTDELWKAWFTPAKLTNDSDEAVECILGILEAGPKNTRELIREAAKDGHPKSAVMAALPKLGGRVRITPGPRGARLYSLCEGGSGDGIV